MLAQLLPSVPTTTSPSSMPPEKTSKKNAKWTDPEVIALLNTLLEKKSSHQSGNSWKPSVWPDVVKAVQLVNPNAMPAKDQQNGTGWDEEEKHAVNTTEYIKEFLASVVQMRIGAKFVLQARRVAKCREMIAYYKLFARMATSEDKISRSLTSWPCPFYSELNELYDGLKNRATGEHVVHFPRKSRSRTSGVENNNPAAAAASTSTAKAPTLNEMAASDARAPMLALGNILPEEEICVDGGSHGGDYPDELTLSPAKPPTKRTRTESDDDEPNDPADPKGKHRRVKSDSSTTSTCGRNADAASQLARSVDSLSAAMLKPIVTMQDILYVNNVMLVLNDPTANLLPPDPRGKLFNLVSKALTASQTQAWIFILASDHSRRRGIIAGILEDAGVDEY
ncbi:hypothetical protein DFH08DRAFT_963257 [Mycena albidolilacea]|uniref:Myb/SANT-like domain-containing protein n=1 Tax=Mycena albidolilacea TaxID=1033008 RepID=A0AAD6ZVL6_9AGAR|nr:hypothetical protein DFH08DRAFT_963257 [Mycena albidolilacea]